MSSDPGHCLEKVTVTETVTETVMETVMETAMETETGKPNDFLFLC